MGESVEVMTKFERGRIKPMWFVWRGRDFRVKGLPMTWERKDGGRRFLCFAVDTGGSLFELRLDRESYQFSVAGCQSSD